MAASGCPGTLECSATWTPSRFSPPCRSCPQSNTWPSRNSTKTTSRGRSNPTTCNPTSHEKDTLDQGASWRAAASVGGVNEREPSSTIVNPFRQKVVRFPASVLSSPRTGLSRFHPSPVDSDAGPAAAITIYFLDGERRARTVRTTRIARRAGASRAHTAVEPSQVDSAGPSRAPPGGGRARRTQHTLSHRCGLKGGRMP